MSEFNGLIIKVTSQVYQTFNALIEDEKKHIIRLLDFKNQCDLYAEIPDEVEKTFRSVFLYKKLSFTVYNPFRIIEVAEEGKSYLLIFTRDQVGGNWAGISVTPLEPFSEQYKKSQIENTTGRFYFDLP